MHIAPSPRPSELDKLAIMADYTPSDELRAEIAAFKAADAALNAAREKLRRAVADELLAHDDATSKNLAPHLPWSDETIRGIAREFEVPLKRAPTVQSIKKAGA